MMAKMARVFQDHLAVDLMIVSPDPRIPKRIKEGVRKFVCVIRLR